MVMLKSGNKIFVADFFRHYRYKTYKNPFFEINNLPLSNFNSL